MKRFRIEEFVFLRKKVHHVGFILFIITKSHNIKRLTNRSEKKTFGKYLAEMYVFILIVPDQHYILYRSDLGVGHCKG